MNNFNSIFFTLFTLALFPLAKTLQLWLLIFISSLVLTLQITSNNIDLIGLAWVPYINKFEFDHTFKLELLGNTDHASLFIFFSTSYNWFKIIDIFWLYVTMLSPTLLWPMCSLKNVLNKTLHNFNLTT